jgi:hypothetical protein
VAVFDAFWGTAGGGEAYAAGVAEALSRHHDVTLLANEPVDTAWLGERLAADLSGVTVTVVDPTVPLVASSAGYDLLVNLSYRDHGENGATRGIYVVHFPDRPGADRVGWQRAVNALGRPLRRRPSAVEPVRGFHRPDVVRWQEVRWTDGHGVLKVRPPVGPGDVLELWFGRFVPGGAERRIRVTVDGATAAEAILAPPRSRLEVVEPLRVVVDVPPGPDEVLVGIESESAVAHDVIGNGDRRRLGVPLVAATTRRGPARFLGARASLLTAEPPTTGWLDSYDLVVANSPFTRRWIDRWWRRPSVVLEPPVRLRSPGPKDDVILSVGRFFAPGRGHAKKQLEMVQAFATLCRAGVADGWSLHLVGGCDTADRDYLASVRAAARDLPVELHVDATGDELDGLYRRAAVYWHATGLGEDVDADPVRAEHFGITTVEAMSAGAVPVVMAAGGQPDIVRDGVDGFVFHDLDGLVARTAELLGDPVRRGELSAAAVARARPYGFDRFSARLSTVVAGLIGDGPGAA